ncbi:MAG: N-acetylglucosamine kinase [Anaerolineales bacterium]
MPCFLGVDIGSTKTYALLCDERGQVRGVGRAGAGNHQVVGYDGMLSALRGATHQALSQAGVAIQEIASAGFGISGYDWSSDKPDVQAVIAQAGITAPYELYNDAILGLVAGAQDGWGVAVVSGTGCTCWGWDRLCRRIGRVTGMGVLMGEAAGASELVYRAMQLVGYAWTKRSQPTALSEAFLGYTGAHDLEDLLAGYTTGRYLVDAGAAPLVFQVANSGDDVALQLVRWAGSELGELANAVIRQLEFQELEFDVVLMGSMFDGGSLLVDPMRATIQKCAPRARLVRLAEPPAVGALLIAMRAGGLQVTSAIRRACAATVPR